MLRPIWGIKSSKACKPWTGPILAEVRCLMAYVVGDSLSNECKHCKLYFFIVGSANQSTNRPCSPKNELLMVCIAPLFAVRGYPSKANTFATANQVGAKPEIESSDPSYAQASQSTFAASTSALQTSRLLGQAAAFLAQCLLATSS